MNAKQMLAKLDGYGGIIPFNSEELEVTLRALRLLAAAECNDGSTPLTDREEFDDGLGHPEVPQVVVIADFARTLERERDGLAARVGELEPDAGRYRWILHQAAITDFIFKFLKSNERHVSNAIDAARKP